MEEENDKMENNRIIKATFKTNNKKHLDFILKTLKDTFGNQNVTALSPVFVYRYQIYILDMDITIADALNKLSFDFKEE